MSIDLCHSFVLQGIYKVITAYKDRTRTGNLTVSRIVEPDTHLTPHSLFQRYSFVGVSNRVDLYAGSREKFLFQR